VARQGPRHPTADDAALQFSFPRSAICFARSLPPTSSLSARPSSCLDAGAGAVWRMVRATAHFDPSRSVRPARCS
jgi:hypothetical protein